MIKLEKIVEDLTKEQIIDLYKKHDYYYLEMETMAEPFDSNEDEISDDIFNSHYVLFENNVMNYIRKNNIIIYLYCPLTGKHIDCNLYILPNNEELDEKLKNIYFTQREITTSPTSKSILLFFTNDKKTICELKLMI